MSNRFCECNKANTQIRCKNYKKKDSRFCASHQNCKSPIAGQPKLKQQQPKVKQQPRQPARARPADVVIDLTDSPGPKKQQDDVVYKPPLDDDLVLPFPLEPKKQQQSKTCDAILKTGKLCTISKKSGARFCGIHGKGVWPYIKGQITPQQVLQRQRSLKKDRFTEIMQKGGQLQKGQRDYLAAKCGYKCCPLIHQGGDECKYGICNPPPPQHMADPQKYKPLCKPNCDKITAKLVRKNSVRKRDPKNQEKQDYYKYLDKFFRDAYDANKCRAGDRKKVSF